MSPSPSPGYVDRYWVGGTGNWSDTAHWSYESGGSGGAAVPDSTKDVFIDENSGFGGGGTITFDVSAYCHDITCTSGHTFAIESNNLEPIYIDGSFTLEAGITVNSIYSFYFTSSDIGNTITTAGVTIENNGAFDFTGTGSWILQDDLIVLDTQFYQENGTFDANDHNVTANDFYFYADTGCTPTIIMGGGTWEVTGDNGWQIEEYNGEVVTVTPETSTIKVFNTFNGAGGDSVTGKTYYNVWIVGETLVYRTNIFNDLKIDAGQTVYFEDGETQTVTTFTAVGTLGNLITLNNTDAGDQFILSKSSGTVECDYLNISNSNAIGGATWYAGLNSLDTTNNDGWIFGALESYSPSISPSLSPSISPSISPSLSPSISPSISPSLSPSISPSISPSFSPSVSPSLSPSISPSISPSLSPSVSPSISPSPSIPDNCVVDQEQTTIQDIETFGYLGQISEGQTFKPSVTASLCNIQVRVDTYGSPVDSLQLSIYTDGTGEPGVLLATADNTISGASIPNQTNVNFTFTDGPLLTAETTYWFVIERTGELSGTSFYRISTTYDSTDYYDRGTHYTYIYVDGDTYWEEYSWPPNQIVDLYFKSYYDNTTVSSFSPSVSPSISPSISPSPAKKGYRHIVQRNPRGRMRY